MHSKHITNTIPMIDINHLYFIFIVMLIPLSATAELCQQQVCTIVGTNKSDYIIGTNGDDVICGGNGKDTILGMQGNDLICGGNGNDNISGNSGNDILVGGRGNDELHGGTGDDDLYGNQGNDTLIGGGEKDLLRGGTGNNTVNGVKTKSKQNHANKSASTFNISSNQIISSNDELFIPRGVNIFPWHGNTQSISKITDNCWNFNMVRLHAWILPRQNSRWKDHVVYVDEPVIFNPNTVAYTTYDVAPLIESYTNQGIVVLFDIHDHIGRYFEGEDLEDYITFIKDFTKKYKDNPYVWLDIHNEPGTYDGINNDFTKWRTEVTTIMDTVRSIAPDMITLIPGAAWGQDTGPRWSNNNVLAEESALLANFDVIGNYENVIATVHMYDQWTYNGLPRLLNFVDQLNTTLDIPIIVGEYGSNNINSTIQATRNLHTMLLLPGYENIGRVAWIWDANDANDLTTDQSGGGLWADSCTNPTNLTEFGQLVWDDNH